ncbi:MAG: hypothetical protein AABZ39_17940 [Spirochaetota bacterium]
MDLAEFDVLEKSIVHLIDELKAAKEADADRGAEVSSLKTKYDHTIRSLEAKIDALETENKSLREERNTMEKQRNIIKKRLDDIMGKIEVAKDSIEASAKEKGKPKYTQIETIDGTDISEDEQLSEPVVAAEKPVQRKANTPAQALAHSPAHSPVPSPEKKRDVSVPVAAVEKTAPVTTVKPAEVVSLTDEEDPFTAAKDDSWEKLDAAEKAAPVAAVADDDDEYLIGNEDDESESFWHDEQKA